MTRTRDEWLSSLTWNDGPPPTNSGSPPTDKYDIAYNAGMVYELKDGDRVIVGDINDSGGSCSCCGGMPNRDEVVRWAEFFGANP